MKKIFIALALVVSGAAGTAQQDYQFTHFMFDHLSYNPGYAGLNNSICGGLLHRQQWAGFTGGGHPQTTLLNVHAPVSMLRGGLGLSVFNDQLGFENNIVARLSYSYHKALGVGTLGAGLSVGMINKKIQATWVTPDGTSYTLDPTINTVGQNNSGTVADIGFGAFYMHPEFYVGLSATHLGNMDMTNLSVENVHHYWITAGYKYAIGDFDIKPNILAKSDGASTQMDFNVHALWKDMVWAGATYRIGDAIAPMAGYQTEIGPGKLKIGYSYGVTLSNLASYSNGSHDIMVNYCVNLDKPPVRKVSKNPRFL